MIKQAIYVKEEQKISLDDFVANEAQGLPAKCDKLVVTEIEGGQHVSVSVYRVDPSGYSLIDYQRIANKPERKR